MNTIEDRLRNALAERARRSPVGPGAWEQTLARTRRRRRDGGWTRFAIPAAAAAAVVAIVVGATVLTGHGGQGGGPGGRGGPSQAGPTQAARPAPPGRNDYLIQQDPPVSQVVSVKVGTQGQARWVYVWFARMRGGQGTVLCSEIRTGKILSAAGCESVQLAAGQGAVLTAGDGWTRLGATVSRADSVLARLPGHSAAGQLISGRGFPAKVWLVSYQTTGDVTIVFRDVTGHQVGRLTFAGANPPHAQPRHGGVTVFRNHTGAATAYLIAGRVCVWSTAPPEQFIFVQPASRPPALTVASGFPTSSSAGSSEFFGYAHGNVTRVTLRLADGKLLTARTFPGWPGSGIRLWAVPGPATAAMAPKYVALAYDAAGQVVGQVTNG